jgi:hypothetical protein
MAQGQGPKADKPAHDRVAKQMDKAQQVMDKMHEKIASGSLTAEEIAEAEQTIADMTAKMERLSGGTTAP